MEEVYTRQRHSSSKRARIEIVVDLLVRRRVRFLTEEEKNGRV